MACMQRECLNARLPAICVSKTAEGSVRAPNRKKSMALRFPATCLATLAFVTDQFPTTAAFSVALGAHKRQRNGRIRARLSSSDRSEDGGHRVPPSPERRSRADINSPIVDLALLNLSSAGGGKPAGTPAGRTGSVKEQTRSASSGRLNAASARDDVSAARPEQAAGRARVHPAVERQLASGNVLGAVSLLASAADEIETNSRRNLNASDPTAAADGVNGAASASLSDGFAAVLQSCTKRGLWREAHQVITRYMPAAEVEVSTADWLLAIDACAGPEGAEQAIFSVHDMRIRGFEITRDVYGAAVRACALSGDTGRALFLLKDATKRGLPLLPTTVAAMMRAAGWLQALAIYDAFVDVAAGQAQTRSSPEGTTLGGIVGGSLGDAGRDLPAPPPRGQARQLHLLSEVAPGWESVCQAALEACAKGGKWESALEILNVLRAGGGGAELSREAYDQAIKVCGDAKAWDMVLLLVAEMRSDGVPTSPAAFETALKGCAATGSWLWARSLMSSVSADASSGIRLTIAHYLEALRACAAVVDKPGGGQARSAAIAALELLQDIREARWLSGRQGEEAYFWAMKACIAAQDAWSALALLESAQDDRVRRNMALRTAAMQACSGAGEWRAALSILDDVHLEGLRPSGAAYVAAMGACARGGVVDLALELLDKVLVEHPGDKRTITSGYHGAIAACAECGHWEGATSLLQRMRQDPLVVVTAKEYNAAILACCRAQQSVAALTLLGDMSLEDGAVAQESRPSAGGNSKLRPDETSYICVMRSFGKEGRWRTVLDLLGSMKEEAGLVPSISTYNVVVEALAKAGEWQRALGMLTEMKREGVRPTEFTYNRCMTACEKSGQWEQSLSLMTDMKEQGDLVPDSYMCSTAMMACSKAGRLDDVLGILQELRELPGGKGPNLVNYNIAIGSCARARDWTRMLEEMDNMRWEDFKPEESTFSVPLDVCARSGDLSMALTLLARMRECKVKPGVVTYGSAVAAACRAGDAASAAVLLDDMEGAGHPPNEVTYGVAALACRDAANVDAAVDLLLRRERQGLPPDPLVLSFAVQACSKAGDLERGLDLITGMKSAGFVPDGLFYTSVIAGIGASFSPTRVRSGPMCDED